MKNLFFLLILFISFNATAQNATDSVTAKEQPKTSTFKRVINQKPKYPGGINAFYEYLIKKLQSAGFVSGLQGTIILTFVVEKDGTITNIQIKQGIEKNLNLAVIKAVKESLRWTPGLQDGKPVRTQYTLPVTFN